MDRAKGACSRRAGWRAGRYGCDPPRCSEQVAGLHGAADYRARQRAADKPQWQGRLQAPGCREDVMAKPILPPRTDLARSLVAENFSGSGDELVIGGVSVGELARTYGTPLFAYDAGLMRRSYRSLRRAVSGLAEVYYSIKANPNPAVVSLFVEEGAGLEIASGAEFLRARSAGCPPERVVFAGPAKSPDELALTIAAGIGEVHLESYEEIEHVARIAAKLGRSVPVAVRVNPVAAARGGAMQMGGRPAPFGFDEEDLAAVLAAIDAHPLLHISGIHVFAGTQILDAEVLL